MSRPGQSVLPYVLIAPALACELVVHVVPTLLGLVLSLLRVDQFTIGNWPEAPFVGTGNYRTAADPSTAVGAALLQSFGVTVSFTIIVVGLCWALGLLAAVLLSKPVRGRSFFRVLFVLPFALPAYVSSVGWRFLFARDDGAVNHLIVDNLHLAHDRPFWLVGDHAFWALVIASVWRLWPFAFLMLSAAFTSVPQERYEEAAMSGANAWCQLRVVTMPSIRRMNAVVLLVMALWTFNEFTVPWVLFGGAPPSSGTLLSTLVYRQAFGTFDVGVASATNILMVATLLIAGAVYVRRFLPRDEVNG